MIGFKTRNARQRRVMLATLLLAAATLTACSADTKRVLGLTRAAPDEFAVIARAPLNVPPDFKLRPPRAGAQRPQANDPREQARQTIFRTTSRRDDGSPIVAVQPRPGQSRGEAALLSRAGVAANSGDIRRTVDRESAVLARADDDFLNRLLNFKEAGSRDPLLDASGEARRLRENQALGRLANEGEVPTIERKRRGLLDRLF